MASGEVNKCSPTLRLPPTALNFSEGGHPERVSKKGTNVPEKELPGQTILLLSGSSPLVASCPSSGKTLSVGFLQMIPSLLSA